MNHVTKDKRPQPMPASMLVGLLISAALAGALARPAAARQPDVEPQIQIAVGNAERTDPAALAQVRRRIASAARAVCETGGVSSVYRNGARRCRELTVADAERQLEAGPGARLASR